MMEETERDCLLFAFYATVGEVIDQVSAASSLSQRHTEDLTDNISSILQHGCSVQVTQDTVDYWPFIEGLQTLQPCLCAIIDRFSRKPFDSNKERCLAWIRYSLQEQALQSHLAILVANQDHVKRNYHEHAFLKSRHHMSALRDCLKALDQKNMDLLPDLVDFTSIGEFSPSPKDDPPVSFYNGYDSGVECAAVESMNVAMKQQRTLEFGRIREVSAVAPSSAVANFERTKSCSFHSLSNLDGGGHHRMSGAQGLLQKLQQDERKARSLTTTPELQARVLSQGDDSDAETQTLPDGYTRAHSPESNISIHSEDSFVVIASNHAATHPLVQVKEEIVDQSNNEMSLPERVSDKKGRRKSTISQENTRVMNRRQQEDYKKPRAQSAVSRVSLLETMGSPRLFASDSLEKDNAHFAVADMLIAALEEVNAIHLETSCFSSSPDEGRQFVRLRTRRQSGSVSNHSDELEGSGRKYESEDEEFELSDSWIVAVERQNYRCAGCSLKINSQHIKFFRYCEYMGRYFCSSCHANNVHIIPARVLHKWDFRPYPVSNFAYELLSGIFYDPVFNVSTICRPIIHKVKELRIAAQLRRQLYYLKDFISACRLADSLLPDFQRFGYIVSDPEWTLYSLNDMNVLHNGGFVRELKDMLLRGLKHVSGCQLCSARGFVCEVCNNAKDIIFPFQVIKCIQCQRCRNCFHRVCFDKVKGHCKRCERVRARKIVGSTGKNVVPS